MNPAFFPIISSIIDKVGSFFPSEEEKNRAKLALLTAEQNGELEQTKAQLSAIIAEANSTDPWTSRARPSFMYVIYICILFGIPMGILSVWSPGAAAAIATGFKGWLTAIPDTLYTLFGAGYLGYTGSRTVEKIKGVTR